MEPVLHRRCVRMGTSEKERTFGGGNEQATTLHPGLFTRRDCPAAPGGCHCGQVCLDQCGPQHIPLPQQAVPGAQSTTSVTHTPLSHRDWTQGSSVAHSASVTHAGTGAASQQRPFPQQGKPAAQRTATNWHRPRTQRACRQGSVTRDRQSLVVAHALRSDVTSCASALPAEWESRQPARASATRSRSAPRRLVPSDQVRAIPSKRWSSNDSSLRW
jgi:hypothetical protein